MDTLKMMYELFTRARRDRLMALETDSDNPEGSTIFSKCPKFLADRYALAFVCDSIRMASSCGIEPFDADQMMENDMEVHHQEASTPIVAFMKGTAPSVAVEIGRRAIPGRVRPGFREAEMYIKDKNSAPVAVAA